MRNEVSAEHFSGTGWCKNTATVLNYSYANSLANLKKPPAMANHSLT
jgi:hypothetical protein